MTYLDWFRCSDLDRSKKMKLFDLNAEKVVLGSDSYPQTLGAIYISTDNKTNYFYLDLYEELDEFHLGCADLTTCQPPSWNVCVHCPKTIVDLHPLLLQFR